MSLTHIPPELILHLPNSASEAYNVYVHITKVNQRPAAKTPEQELSGTKDFLGLVEYRIKSQKRLLRGIVKNKWKCTEVSKQMLYNLASWELVRLQKTRKEAYSTLPVLDCNINSQNGGF